MLHNSSFTYTWHTLFIHMHVKKTLCSTQLVTVTLPKLSVLLNFFNDMKIESHGSTTSRTTFKSRFSLQHGWMWKRTQVFHWRCDCFKSGIIDVFSGETWGNWLLLMSANTEVKCSKYIRALYGQTAIWSFKLKRFQNHWSIISINVPCE